MVFAYSAPLMSDSQESREPSLRAQQILRALVEHYIRDGQPVGSRTLAKSTGLALSPASIRNVMSDLEELGFIAAPHTSAGRIPTPKGYRFFVDTLIKLQQPGSRDLSRLQLRLEEESQGNSKILAANASEALSTLTSLAGIVTIPRPTHAALRQVEFMPLSERRVLAILVVNEVEVQNRILHMDRDYSRDELRHAANYLTQNFIGQELPDIRQAVLAEMQKTRANMNQMMLDVVTIAEKALAQDNDSEGYVVSGQTKLMDFDELSNVDTLKHLFEAFNQQRDLLSLLDRSIAADGVQIFIGEESGYQMLDECSLVAAPYGTEDEVVGVLGVIGPTRMAYERVIPIVDITARLLSAALKSSH
jgi:heat-inducible transcriptional repressor